MQRPSGPKLADLLIDHANRTCSLRSRPAASGRGRRTQLTAEQVRHGRYLYWVGRATAATLGERWGISRQAASLIVNFRRLAHL